MSISLLYIYDDASKKILLLLLDVLKELPVTLKYRCLLYGDGEQKNQIRGRIDELQLADKVFIKGFVNYNDMTKVYRGGKYLFCHLSEKAVATCL